MKNLMPIYRLCHINYNGTNLGNGKELGVYSSLLQIEEAIAFYLELPGFSNTTNSYFDIKLSFIDINFSKKYYRIYVVINEDEQNELVLDLGLFTSNYKARKVANEHLSLCPDKKNNKIYIYKLDLKTLDERLWTGGFGSILKKNVIFNIESIPAKGFVMTETERD